ncbi:MAG: low molecular weight phosphatase family protein [Nitrospiraceae bacterium]
MRVLFVCTGNTCRSVLAEYISRGRFRGQIDAESAGVQPGSVEDSSNAIYTLRQHGIDARAHKPRDVRGVNIAEFDLIVTMDNQVARTLHELFPALPSERLKKWRINDPYGDDLAEYDECAKVIHRELKRMLSSVAKRPST